MANMKLSYDEMAGVAKDLDSGREEITTRLQAMQVKIQGLVSSGFVTDQASGKFNDAYTRYTSSANAVIAQLTEISAFITSTANAGREFDSQVASQIN